MALLPAVFLYAEGRDDQLFKKGEELFSSALYPEAISTFQQVEDPDIKPLASLRIGQAYFLDKQYAKALEYLVEGSGTELPEKENQLRLLQAGISFSRLGNYVKAIEVLNSSSPSAYRDESLFELGLASFFLGRLDDASSFFHQLDEVKDKKDLHTLSRFYLARIALAENHPAIALELLEGLSAINSHSHQEELAYLQGLSVYQQRDFQHAAALFESSIGAGNEEKPWVQEARFKLGWSYLKQAEEKAQAREEVSANLSKAASLFSKLSAESRDERFTLSLAQTYIACAVLMHEAEALVFAEKALSELPDDASNDARKHLLLLQAEAAGSYAAKDSAYGKMVDAAENDSVFLGKIWYLRALSDLEEARKYSSAPLFAKAAAGFHHAYPILKQESSPEESLCLQYLIQSYWEKGDQDSRIAAIDLLQKNIDVYPDNDNLDVLVGAYVVDIVENDMAESVMEKAEELLKRRIKERSDSPALVLALGSFYSKREQYPEAQEIYLEFVDRHPDSPFVPQMLNQAAVVAERLPHGQKKAAELRKKVYEQYPDSEFAPAAYFFTYSYQDYLQGDRAAIKHLAAFKEKFPSSPILINVNYMLGLDLKRDRRTLEGKWVRKKNPTGSIQAFHEAESLFDNLYRAGKIPPQDLEYYIKLRYRAVLERALVHYAVAEESNAAKHEIYLQYAMDTLVSLRRDLENPAHPLTPVLTKECPFSSVHEECLYWLALSSLKGGDEESAKKIFDDMLENYHSAKMVSGYYLSRVFYEQGMLALEKQNYTDALAYMTKAEEASRGKYLSADEKLTLWIQQSECCKALGNYENAMLALSRVINDNSISHLRLKAMLMRAELYELMGRPELAKRQLEAVAKMGGEWAVQAKQKLERDYATP